MSAEAEDLIRPGDLLADFDPAYSFMILVLEVEVGTDGLRSAWVLCGDLVDKMSMSYLLGYHHLVARRRTL